MYNETPFFHHYTPVSYEGYEVSPASLIGVLPVECKYSPIDWSKVECVGNPNGIGTKTATQTILQQAIGAAACDKDANGSNANGTQIIRKQVCTPNPIDCIMSDWRSVGTCSTTCGDGMQQQTRTILLPPSYGGKECGPIIQNIPCNLGVCPTTAPTTTAPTTASPTTIAPMTAAPTTAYYNKKMMYAGAAVVVVLGVGLYFYLSKKQ